MIESSPIHQTLHGYSRGHRLLAASLRLPPEAESALLTMSDFAGTRVIPGFETYLTGYPLPGTDLYAIAQTWYASEMPRPGSVWTHSLLLSFSAVAALDLRRLHSLPFRRPDSTNIASYSQVVNRPKLDVISMETPSSLFVRSDVVVSRLYEQPDAAVVIYVQDSHCVKDLFFRLWLQQWAALRYRFTFSTGSIGPRSVLRRPIDLQAAPAIERFSWGRHLDAPIAEVNSHDSVPHDEPWMRLLATELTQEHSSLHKFFDRFTSDVSPTRHQMKPLCQIFLTLNDHQVGQADELARLSTNAFPQSREASALKRALLSGSFIPGIDPLISPKAIAERIAKVLSQDNDTAFSSDHIDASKMVELIIELDVADRSYLLDSLLTNESSPLAQAVGHAIADLLEPDQISTLARNHAGLLHFLIKCRPALAGKADYWHISASARAEIIDALPVDTLDGQLTRMVIELVLALQLHDVAEALLKQLGTPAVHEVLDRMTDGTEAQALAPWRKALSRRTSDALDWLLCEHTKPALAVRSFGQLLDERALSSWIIPIEAAKKLATGLDDCPVPEQDRVASFLLAKAMGERTPDWSDVVIRTFPIVHRGAADNRLSFQELAWLEDGLPEVPGWKRWDRCHRLRKGLVELVLKYEWPETILLDAAGHEDTVRQIFNLLDKKGKSRELLRNLIEVVSIDSKYRQYRSVANEY